MFCHRRHKVLTFFRNHENLRQLPYSKTLGNQSSRQDAWMWPWEQRLSCKGLHGTGTSTCIMLNRSVLRRFSLFWCWFARVSLRSIVSTLLNMINLSFHSTFNFDFWKFKMVPFCTSETFCNLMMTAKVLQSSQT